MKKNKILFIALIILFLSANLAIASYKSIIPGEARTFLKIPVFLFSNPNPIQKNMSSVNENFVENTFNVLNYIDEKQLVNEVDFEYTIKIIPSTLNFPVKYKLIDLESNSEIALDSNLETKKLSLSTNRENHNYKLVVEWDMENSNQNLESKLDVEILVKGVQKQV